MKVFAEKQMTNVSINTKLEGKVATIQPGPERSELVKLVNDRASQIKSKVGKRKRELSARFSSKQPEESSDEPRAKQPRPNTPQNKSVGDIDRLRDIITRISNNES